MIRDDEGRKLTPTQVAKAAIEHAAYMAVEAPLSTIEHMVEVDDLSPAETGRIADAIAKQYARVRKMMGFDPL